MRSHIAHGFYKYNTNIMFSPRRVEDRQTDRDTQRQTDTDRQTDRQTDTHTYGYYIIRISRFEYGKSVLLNTRINV